MTIFRMGLTLRWSKVNRLILGKGVWSLYFILALKILKKYFSKRRGIDDYYSIFLSFVKGILKSLNKGDRFIFLEK